jgi:hypothetical protein
MKKTQYVDWSKIPEGYDWVAVDSKEETEYMVSKIGSEMLPNSNGVGAYKMKPRIKEGLGGKHFNLGMDDILVPNDAIIGPLPPWRNSLMQRPRA